MIKELNRRTGYVYSLQEASAETIFKPKQNFIKRFRHLTLKPERLTLQRR